MNTCITCNNATSNPRFCSRSCAAKYNNKIHPKRKTKRVCFICGKPVKSYRNSRCFEHQEEYLSTRFDYIKELPLSHYWSKKSLQNLHQSSKNAHIRILARNHFKDLLLKPCAKCGYNKHVELCHIKPIREFQETSLIREVNSYENLIQLCPNCHWEFDQGLFKLSELSPR